MRILDASLIELLLAPAVLLPACGLFAMSTSARLSAILARIRDLHQQRLHAFAELPSAEGTTSLVYALRVEGLEVQSHWLIRRAGLTRTSLSLVYASTAALLLSSMSLGASLVWDQAEYAALVLFGVGVLLLTGSVAFAMLDVRQALRWVKYEHNRIAELAKTSDGMNLDPSSTPASH